MQDVRQHYGGTDRDGRAAPHARYWHDGLLPDLRRGTTWVIDTVVAYFWPLVESEAERCTQLGGECDDLIGEGGLASRSVGTREAAVGGVG